MAHRYHQTERGREHESRAMKRHSRPNPQSRTARHREHRGPVEQRRHHGMRHNPHYSPAEPSSHQSRRDREHESRGTHEYWSHMHREESHHHRGPRDDMRDNTQLYHMGKGYYGPGYGEPSNLPQQVEQHYYPRTYSNLEADYPDTLREIDEDMHDSFEKVAHYPSDSMY